MNEKEEKSRLTTLEIERLPEEEFKALPEGDMRRYFERMDRENLLLLAEVYDFEPELRDVNYEGQIRELPLGQVVCSENARSHLVIEEKKD